MKASTTVVIVDENNNKKLYTPAEVPVTSSLVDSNDCCQLHLNVSTITKSSTVSRDRRNNDNTFSCSCARNVTTNESKGDYKSDTVRRTQLQQQQKHQQKQPITNHDMYNIHKNDENINIIPQTISALSLSSTTSSSSSDCSTISLSDVDDDDNNNSMEQQQGEITDPKLLLFDVEQQQHQPQHHDQLFFSPRRRINSAQYASHNNTPSHNRMRTISDEPHSSYPVVPTLSFGSLSDISVEDKVQLHDGLEEEIHQGTNIVPFFYGYKNVKGTTIDNGSTVVRRLHSTSRWNNPIRGIASLLSSLIVLISCQSQQQQHEQRMKRNAQQRRYLLLLFIIATYTTFGLALPNVQEGMIFKNPNILIVDDVPVQEHNADPNKKRESEDPLFIVLDSPILSNDVRTDTSIPVLDPSAGTILQLRGSSTNQAIEGSTQNQGMKSRPHLSFAHGVSSSVSNQQQQNPLLIYRRREVQDFYRQPALSTNYDVSTFYSWYLNCLVLLAIALYYGIREHKILCRTCRTTTNFYYRQ